MTLARRCPMTLARRSRARSVPAGCSSASGRCRRQRSQLVGRERPPRAGRKRRSWIGPMRVRTRRGHGMADGLAHPPDLAVAALVDRDPQHAGARLGDLGRRGRAVVQLDAVAQRGERRRRRPARRPPWPGTPCRCRGAGGRCGWPARRRWSSSSRPSVSASSRPTGNTRGSAGHQLDDGRAARGCRCAVVTTPRGLLSR